jgi:alpha-L-fucosidase
MKNLPVLPFFCLVVILHLISCKQVAVKPPEPFGLLPSERHLQWHSLEYYGFLHFGLNTFTDQEWGYGDVSPAEFNPTDFDADQIVSVAYEAGMKGLILTCKHHDGFCLWPSKYTEYSVKSSPWKRGQGDVVREISEACQRYGLKFGVYLSPWDRNHSEYGNEAYIDYYRNQLTELLTNYGPVFEVWFDGANGGDGWYDGADETRQIDRSTYYGWPDTWQLVRALQPDAVLFSDVGPDVRWIGNEKGIAGDPCWATYTPQTNDGSEPGPGQSDYSRSPEGTRNGEFWIPAECDVSIRPGWFYHASQDTMVKSPEMLLDLYYMSVGRGASLLLNIPPDQRGRIPDKDAAVLKQFREKRDGIFQQNIAALSRIIASNIRGRKDDYQPLHLLDNDPSTYWATDDWINQAELVLEFDRPVVFNVVKLQEYLPLGQRINKWAVDIWEEDAWILWSEGSSIGNKRLRKGLLQTTNKVRIRIVDAPVCPALSEIGLYLDRN